MEKKFKHTCFRCGYIWEGKLEHPKSCPNCKMKGFIAGGIACPRGVDKNNNGGWAGPCYGCRFAGDNTYPLECRYFAPTKVIRRRIEDALRENTSAAQMLEIAKILGVSVD